MLKQDPSGRYGRFREILGKGAMKTVYKGFDEVLGIEVAWNQVYLKDVFHSPEELQRLYSEVHLLKNLDHDSIIRFHASWIDTHHRTFNFITEMFTSGTLREYRQKYRNIDIDAIKNWARQILHGLVYLHGHNPPVIHRDLKCDNLFINGHLGQVKIGDLGLATILHDSQHAHSVIGTPEFMAPELYDEEYNELVDVYSFGMCVIEMLTLEYPYSECSNPAQIYKKVTSGKLPNAFYKIKDFEAQRFVRKCLENVSKRVPARELLFDPFLAPSNNNNGSSDNEDLLSSSLSPKKSMARRTDMAISGSMNPEDDSIFLKVQIKVTNGKSKNVYFAFDPINDTAIDVATEMVKELEIISDWDPLEIAVMIKKEISTLIPDWEEWKLPKNHHQDSFNYEQDDNDDNDNDDDDKNFETPHPFYCCSSHGSSSNSLQDFYSFYENPNHHFGGTKETSTTEWFQEDILNIDDDTSSSCSLNSFNYSDISFYSNNEDEHDSNIKGREPQYISTTKQPTRFCPIMKMVDREIIKSQSRSNNSHRLTRVKSMVNLRSETLHRSLIEMLLKKRLFNTVGAMENIGYQEP
ncbi:probable serine/threonine-protein kinase WNK5 [Benincasa hispida]|uniref:probable serine/threonine-protein kinase WNK5 n=1 Tax=Benincasa hispida TaxID=102211 RepID=UPI0018FFB4D3|nr:probable serine/threonine-protein kinase WNK5 [Benincasa hispida]